MRTLVRQWYYGKQHQPHRARLTCRDIGICDETASVTLVGDDLLLSHSSNLNEVNVIVT